MNLTVAFLQSRRLTFVKVEYKTYQAYSNFSPTSNSLCSVIISLFRWKQLNQGITGHLWNTEQPFRTLSVSTRSSMFVPQHRQTEEAENFITRREQKYQWTSLTNIRIIVPIKVDHNTYKNNRFACWNGWLQKAKSCFP